MASRRRWSRRLERNRRWLVLLAGLLAVALVAYLLVRGFLRREGIQADLADVDTSAPAMEAVPIYTAQDMLDLHFEAMGTLPALRAIEARQLFGRQEQQGYEFQVNAIFKRPDLYRVSLDTEALTIRLYFDGERPSLLHEPQGGQRVYLDLDPSDARSIRRSAEFDSSLVQFPNAVGWEFTPADTNQRSPALSRKMPDGTTRTYTFDPDTHLVRRVLVEHPTDGTVETFFDGYRAVPFPEFAAGASVMFPFHEVIEVNGEKFSEFWCTRVELNPGVPNLIFKPDKVPGTPPTQ